MNVQKFEQISFEAITSIGEGIFIASAMDFNGLFEVYPQNGQCKYVSLFLEEKVNKTRLHACACFISGRVYFIPSSADNIAIYDIITKKISYVPLNTITVECNFNNNYKFADAFIKDDNIYMLPSTFPGILVFNVITEVISIINVNLDGAFFRKGWCRYNDTIFIPSTNNDIILAFNIQTMETKIYHSGKENKGCWSMCNVENSFYLAPKNDSPLLRWLPGKNIIEEISSYPTGFLGNGFLFNKTYYTHGRVYYIPTYANMFISLDLRNGMVEENNIIDMSQVCEVSYLATMNSAYLLRIKYKDARYGFKLLDTEDNSLKDINFLFSERFENWERDYIKKEETVRENSTFDLKNFLHILKYN